MTILTKEKLVTYGIEVIVVVFGILIAFQVEEWREDRQRNRDRHAVLMRLAEETATNLDACEIAVPASAEHARWVLAVVRALNDGHLSAENIEPFDAGLIRVGYILGTPYSVTVAEEMIATGLLKDLDHAELRNHIVALTVWIEGARSLVDDTRGSLKAAVAEVAKAVDFEYHGKFPALEDRDGFDTRFEDGISVMYVFEELVANRTLNNVLIEAADTHLDMWYHHRDLCRRFEEIRSSLAEMNRH
jgi:hypothetical protein